MPSEYRYDPDALNPWLAGLAAGAVGAIAGTVLAFSLLSPDEVIANSVTVTAGALLVGLASGWLWRRVRATSNGLATFRWALVGAFVVTLVAVAIVDQVAISRLIPYGTPIDAVIFVSVGLLTPYLAAHHWPVWTVAVLVAIALAMAVGLFGRGNVESGDLNSPTRPSVIRTLPLPSGLMSARNGPIVQPMRLNRARAEMDRIACRMSAAYNRKNLRVRGSPRRAHLVRPSLVLVHRFNIRITHRPPPRAEDHERGGQDEREEERKPRHVLAAWPVETRDPVDTGSHFGPVPPISLTFKTPPSSKPNCPLADGSEDRICRVADLLDSVTIGRQHSTRLFHARTKIS